MSLRDRLSLNQATVRPLNLAETIALCGRHEINAVGLWRDRIAETGLATAARLIERSGLHVSSLCRGGFFTHSDDAGRQEAYRDNCAAVEEAAALGADTLVLVPGGLPAGSRSLTEARSAIANGLYDLALVADRQGVRLGLEPMHPLFCSDRGAVSRLRDALELVAPLPASVAGVVIDTYHVWWDADIFADIACAANRIAGFQLGDWLVPLPADNLLGRGHIGDGVIDFNPIVTAVLDIGYQGPIEVEIFNQDVWDADPDETATRVLSAWATQLPTGE